MVLAYGAYRLNYLKMESELSKKLEKNVGRIKTPHIYIEKGAWIIPRKLQENKSRTLCWCNWLH